MEPGRAKIPPNPSVPVIRSNSSACTSQPLASKQLPVPKPNRKPKTCLGQPGPQMPHFENGDRALRLHVCIYANRG